jgi:hypothetical protein
MKHQNISAVPKLLVTAIAGTLIAIAGSVSAAPTYSITNVLVADDEYQGETGLTPAPVYKPHETDASATPKYWISSNERGDEETGTGKGGISIFEYGTNKVLSTLNIENACIPVVDPHGPDKCAPKGAEGHPRHPHGIDIDDAKKLAYQVIEHSGLRWNRNRNSIVPAHNTDIESSLLVVYDIADPKNPKIKRGYLLGHAAEEAVVNDNNGKIYAGNHEPSATKVPCFVSVIDPNSPNPYKFIDLPSATQCVQGIDVDEWLNTVNGTTHVGQKMYTFNSSNDTIAYSVNIRPAFDAFVAGLPASKRFTIPDGWVIHLHDLATDKTNHRAYQTIHTIAELAVVEASEEDGAVETDNEITGRWVAEVNTDPSSPNFKKVNIIDLSNGQSVPAFPTHDDAINTGLSYDKLFVHAHFLAVDPSRNSLIVSGEHTGNLGVVDTSSRLLKQVLAISRPIRGCVNPPDPETGEVDLFPEPHVHGTNIQATAGTAYVSDEGENCFYESVTILKP